MNIVCNLTTVKSECFIPTEGVSANRAIAKSFPLLMLCTQCHITFFFKRCHFNTLSYLVLYQLFTNFTNFQEVYDLPLKETSFDNFPVPEYENRAFM